MRQGLRFHEAQNEIVMKFNITDGKSENYIAPKGKQICKKKEKKINDVPQQIDTFMNNFFNRIIPVIICNSFLSYCFIYFLIFVINLQQIK